MVSHYRPYLSRDRQGEITVVISYHKNHEISSNRIEVVLWDRHSEIRDHNLKYAIRQSIQSNFDLKSTNMNRLAT